MRARLCLWPTVAAAIFTMMTTASGGQLNVVEVGAPAVNCVYATNCTITVNDSVGQLTPQNLGQANTAWLQSRTFTGAAGTPGAGKTGYEYRLDMTQATGAVQCVGGIVVNFGPVTQLPFANNTPADVYVVTHGGLGTIGLASADLEGTVITFTFKSLMCASQQHN